MADLNKIIENLSSLTVVEAAELSKQLEEKWGVTAASPVAAAPVAAAAEEEKTELLTELKEFLDSVSLTEKSRQESEQAVTTSPSLTILASFLAVSLASCIL